MTGLMAKSSSVVDLVRFLSGEVLKLVFTSLLSCSVILLSLLLSTNIVGCFAHLNLFFVLVSNRFASFSRSGMFGIRENRRFLLT
jgi:hypothetical protein